MSLNYIHYAGENPRTNPLYDINVNDIDISGNLYRRKSGENENGYLLQCYAPGRARFSAPPRFHQFEYALVGINPVINNDETTDFTFTLTADCVDTDGLITSDGNKITIVKGSNYLVIYKVCRFNSLCTVFSELQSSEVTGALMKSTVSFSSSVVQDSSCYNAEILKLIDGEELSLSRTLLATADVPPPSALILEPNTIGAVAKPALACPSYIMFLKIGA